MARILPLSQKGPPATPKEDFGDKVRAHQRYALKDGTLVPGVTTVLNVLNKPALVPWANRMGLQGIDTSKYVDETASIGTLAHYLVQCELSGEVPQLDDYTPAQLERAQHGLDAFHDWRRDHVLHPHYLEKGLASELHRYGGTIDFGGHVNRRPALVDFKTAKAIYPEHRIQVAAYWQLLIEHGHTIEDVWLLQIPRVEGESFAAHHISEGELKKRWRMFELCLELYRLRKALKD